MISSQKYATVKLIFLDDKGNQLEEKILSKTVFEKIENDHDSACKRRAYSLEYTREKRGKKVDSPQ
jgi:hypothetical protein